GAHTLQRMYGCDLLDNGSTTGYDQIAYDGKDFIAFNIDAMTFIAADKAAQLTKKKWEHGGNDTEHWKNICVEWLKKYVRYGQLMLERRVPPTIRVSGKEEEDGILTLTCRAY
ncbi:HA1F protein, partial [Probosciger aterrimus]|nr:HA1F protein [Probosciger aterrimus]